MNGYLNTLLLMWSLVFATSAFAQATPTNTAIDSHYVFVSDKLPIFPGCETLSNIDSVVICSNQKLLEFVYGNLKIPAAFSQNFVVGSIYVGFTIEKDGLVSNPEVLRSFHPAYSREALRVLQLMIDQKIKWTPGEDSNGNHVALGFMFPVRIHLE